MSTLHIEYKIKQHLEGLHELIQMCNSIEMDTRALEAAYTQLTDFLTQLKDNLQYKIDQFSSYGIPLDSEGLEGIHNLMQEFGTQFVEETFSDIDLNELIQSSEEV